MRKVYKGHKCNDDGDPIVEVPVTRQVFNDLERLASSGIFGTDIEDVAHRMIDESVRQRAVDGWILMPGRKVKRSQR